VLDVARDGLPGDVARRVVGLIDAQAGKVFLPAFAMMVAGMRATDEIGSGVAIGVG
jgi:hypothetical protein